MKLQTVKIAEIVLILLAVVFLGAAYSTNRMIFAILACLSMVGFVLVNVLFWRCPKCGKWLGRDSGKFCTHCGAPLDTENED